MELAFIKSLNNYTDVTGTGEEINFSFTSAFDGCVHSHVPGKLKIFSVEDIESVFTAANSPFTQVDNFFFGVAIPATGSNSSEAYLLVINDIDKFIRFGSKYYGNNPSSEISELNKLYANAYNIDGATNSNEAESRFLRFVKDQDMGISLLKANSDFTAYTNLTLNRDNELVVRSCD